MRPPVAEALNVPKQRTDRGPEMTPFASALAAFLLSRYRTFEVTLACSALVCQDSVGLIGIDWQHLGWRDSIAPRNAVSLHLFILLCGLHMRIYAPTAIACTHAVAEYSLPWSDSSLPWFAGIRPALLRHIFLPTSTVRPSKERSQFPRACGACDQVLSAELSGRYFEDIK